MFLERKGLRVFVYRERVDTLQTAVPVFNIEFFGEI